MLESTQFQVAQKEGMCYPGQIGKNEASQTHQMEEEEYEENSGNYVRDCVVLHLDVSLCMLPE
jgi:hypothetical protein